MLDLLSCLSVYVYHIQGYAYYVYTLRGIVAYVCLGICVCVCVNVCLFVCLNIHLCICVFMYGMYVYVHFGNILRI